MKKIIAILLCLNVFCFPKTNQVNVSANDSIKLINNNSLNDTIKAYQNIESVTINTLIEGKLSNAQSAKHLSISLPLVLHLKPELEIASYIDINNLDIPMNILKYHLYLKNGILYTLLENDQDDWKKDSVEWRNSLADLEGKIQVYGPIIEESIHEFSQNRNMKEFLASIQRKSQDGHYIYTFDPKYSYETYHDFLTIFFDKLVDYDSSFDAFLDYVDPLSRLLADIKLKCIIKQDRKSLYITEINIDTSVSREYLEKLFGINSTMFIEDPNIQVKLDVTDYNQSAKVVLPAVNQVDPYLPKPMENLSEENDEVDEEFLGQLREIIDLVESQEIVSQKEILDILEKNQEIVTHNLLSIKKINSGGLDVIFDSDEKVQYYLIYYPLKQSNLTQDRIEQTFNDLIIGTDFHNLDIEPTYDIYSSQQNGISFESQDQAVVLSLNFGEQEELTEAMLYYKDMRLKLPSEERSGMNLNRMSLEDFIDNFGHYSTKSFNFDDQVYIYRWLPSVTRPQDMLMVTTSVDGQVESFEASWE